MLYSKLDILRQTTGELILQFFSDLSRCQNDEIEKGRMELGTLLVSVGYLKGESNVEIDVIQGKNLPGLDKTGESKIIMKLA